MKTFRPPGRAALVLLLTGLVSEASNANGVLGEAPQPTTPDARFRRPSALAVVDHGATLLVANRRSGTVSEVDAKSEKVVAEHSVGRGLSDLVPLPDGARLVAVDQGAGELLLLDRRVAVVARLDLGQDPVRVAVLPGGKACVVSSRWPRRLDFVGIEGGTGGPSLKPLGSLGLPFSPREVLVLPARDGSAPALFVADAFGGKVAVVDPARRTVLSVRELPAHNLRGAALTADGRGVLVSHQATSRLATSAFDDVHWGALIKNQLTTLRLDTLLEPGADLLRGSSTQDLDRVGHAAGDPEGVAIDPRGRPLVALAGVGEVSCLSRGGAPGFRVAAGTRPTALTVAPDGRSVYAADAEDDAVVIVPLGGGAPRVVPLGARPELTAVGRGERLFSSAKLSHHGWMSCRSCHPEGHTNGRLADTLGDGTYGAPKLVPSLLGVGSTGPWGWLGNFDTLESQVRSSVETTLRGAPPRDEDVADLTAYLRSLGPPPAPARVGGEAEARGREVFRSRGCAACHAAPGFTSDEVRDVGLSDEVGRRAFNPPSLRGVGRRDRFLHDGRAGSLDAVFRGHGHPPGGPLPADDTADLVAYLKTL